MSERYLNLAIGAAARLRILKHSAASGKWVRPMTWRDCRFANFTTPSSAGAGFDGKTPIWYAFGEQFSREKFADECKDIRMDHTGWYTDSEFHGDTARGIVAALPHGKFLAGYYLSMNDERIYFLDVLHDSEQDAASVADEHARVIAEQECEHQSRYREAQNIESNIEGQTARLCECFALRNKAKFAARMRAEIADLIASIRGNRETLAREYSGVL